MKRIRYLLSILLLVGCFVAFSAIASPDIPSFAASDIPADLAIYTDSLSPAWSDWSWDTTHAFNNPSPVHSGSASISVSFSAAWGGFYLHADPPISTSPFDSLRFWVHGGSSGSQGVRLVANGAAVPLSLQANAWSSFSIPLSDLGDPASLSDLFWQDTQGSPQPTFFLDDIALVNLGLPTPPPGAGPTLSVDAALHRHPISPLIYGMNFADEDLASELHLPLRRWGGNATTRFNWQTDTSNRASDWFFENIPNPNSNPALLPDGSAADLFVEQDRRTATLSLLTLPLIGWTPKSRSFDCGFRVSIYGAQQATDPYQSDCGNGRHTNGSPLSGNNPHDTSLEITPTFVSDWINHLKSRFGSASSGGVAFFNLDNEPMLWNSTHRDVHPDPTSYDELRDRTFAYAAAIKAADPSAQTLGPVLWGWTAYFWSALDLAPGGNWWTHPQDRLAHGDLPFVAWYLDQMHAYETAHATRILDFLDLHYYPQASNVALASAGSSATQDLRLRSTRSLWDPAYSDESWIAQPVNLIPRMRAWVDTYYPGTKLAITEYNWGGLEHINGALAQADVLGIFGREGLDLATLWAPPASSQPGAFAFRIFLNYDASRGQFGDTSVLASSSDPDQLSIYAAQRASDGALTILVINKTRLSLTSQLSLANYSPSGMAQVYRYSAQNLSAIQRLADVPVASNGFQASFPASSITLFVLNSGVSTPQNQYYLPFITSH